MDNSACRTVGLILAARYAAPHVLECLLPRQVADQIFSIEPANKSDKKRESRAVLQLEPLLEARDVSFGMALLALAWQSKYREMGTVMLAGTFFFVADAWALWQVKRSRMVGAAMASGVAGWAIIGLGLINS